MKNMIESKLLRHKKNLPVYSFSSAEELMNIIKEVILSDSSIETIQVKTQDLRALKDERNLLCLDKSIYSTNWVTTLNLKHYTLWVYFNNDEVVYSTYSNSGVDSPPHLNTFKDAIFSELVYTSFEKVKF